MLASLLGNALLPSVSHAADSFGYDVWVAGGGVVVQGAALHLEFQLPLTSGTVPTGDYGQLSISGLPAGVSINFPLPAQHTGCCGSFPYQWDIGGGTAYNEFDLQTSSTTTPGTYPVVFSVTPIHGGPTESYTYNFTVITQAQTAIATQPFPPAVPIPELSLWEQNMTAFGQFFCNPQYMSPLYSEGSWFYDGERVYYQMADYTNDPGTWDKCAQDEGLAYQSDIVTASSTFNALGIYFFSKGLRMNYERTGDPNSQAAVNILANRDNFGAWPTSAGDTTDSFVMRETTYALQNLMDSQAVGHAPYAQTKTIMELLLGQLDQVYMSKTYTNYEPFMMGLAFDALIQYYNEISPDPRIPYTVKQALDGFWAQAWDPVNHQINYECFAPGGGQDMGTYCSDALGDENLNLLVAPAYAWMFLKTGNPIYRDRGDLLFADGIKYNGLWDNYGEGGKRFSQTYRWTFDYVKYRKQANALAPATAPTDIQPPDVSIVYPTSGATASVTTTFIANASDNVAVAGVQFKIDGVNAGSAAVSQPYETGVSTYGTSGSPDNNLYQLATYLLPNGSHTVTATAYDTSGNSAVSSPVTFIVNNPDNTSFDACPSSHIPTGAFQGCYYSVNPANGHQLFFSAAGGDSSVPPPASVGTLSTTTTDSAINFDWDYSQKARPPVDLSKFFAVIWQGNFPLSAGNYTFNISKDSNMSERLYVDGQLLSDYWDNYTEPPSLGVSFLVPGTHLIRVEAAHTYFNGGDSPTDNISVLWNHTGSSPPVISNIAVSNITQTGATITWTTDVNSDSQVDYGLTSNYGSSSSLDTTPRTNHTVSLSNLLPGTQYHYRAKSKDAAGNPSAPNDQTFTTQTQGQNPDTTPPTVSITLPHVNDILSGISTPITATAVDPIVNGAFTSGVKNVQFKIDGSNLATILTPPYSTVWDTTKVANGSHTISALATDNAGNISNPSSVVVTVNNSVNAPPPPTLILSLTTNPVSGTAPVTGVSLTAAVSGTATGPMNYYFYCNRADTLTATSTVASPDKLISADNNANETASNLCSYPNSGTYTTKVIVERNGQVSESRANVIVSNPITLGGGTGGGTPTITNFQASALDSQISLSWTDPTDPSFVRAFLVRKQGSNPPSSPTDGEKIYEGLSTSFIDTGLINGQVYSYAIFPVLLTGISNTASGILPATPQAGVDTINSQQSNTTQTTTQSTHISLSADHISALIILNQSGAPVLLLQKVLVSEGLLSPDKQTGFFGPLTQAAVQAFQRKYNIVSSGTPATTGYGNVGPGTRAKINQLLDAMAGSTTTNTQTTTSSTSSQTTGITITTLLHTGTANTQVTVLQQFLAHDPSLYPEGLITGYFGPATQRAVQRYQVRYGIAGPGDQGYGQVGPKTRARLGQ